MRISDTRWVDLGKFDDARGSLRFGEFDKHLPFAPQRIYYSYNVPAGIPRAGHGHRELEQVIIALAGGFTLAIDDGYDNAEYRLEDPGRGVYVPKMLWREVRDFTPDGICLVLASLPYDPAEYIKSYDEFLKLVRSLPC
ncbi:MAG TPA: FdtA/QdtA family cupin domain-containing protein [Alphaproteobacteria bacterium]|nr:FdtA/QdtA family cupin domain-containing protein [Alphaproteobacteria bacterium]